MNNEKFLQALQLNVNSLTEKKSNLTYLSWAHAWAEFKKIYPDGTYKVIKFDGLPYIKSESGYMVYTKVKAEYITHEMWLPVMDNRNLAIKQPDMMQINKSLMRCLTKNLAMFGIGLYVYAGEDLPEELIIPISNSVKENLLPVDLYVLNKLYEEKLPFIPESWIKRINEILLTNNQDDLQKVYNYLLKVEDKNA